MRMDEKAQPELLYHYTTQEGLLGILEKACIWATHYRYLNDASEGQIVSKLLIEELTKRTGDEGVISQGKRILSEITSQDVYATSFSEHGNLLSQWRAYSGISGGYSIGFSPNYLEAIGKHFFGKLPGPHFTPDNPLIQCQYFNDDVERQLKDKIQKVVDSYIAEAERESNVHFLLRNRLDVIPLQVLHLNIFGISVEIVQLQKIMHFMRNVNGD